MSGQTPDFLLSQLTDPKVRDAFRKLSTFLNGELPFTGFRFFTKTYTGPATHDKFPHGLNFTPQDIVLTSKTGVGVVTFNQDLTDSIDIDITVTDACVLRFIAGTFG